MFKYLKAAFLVKKGGLPINLLGVAAIIGLGFLHPAVWIAGVAIEGSFLYGLASNERFQKLTDGLKMQGASKNEEVDVAATLKKIVMKLLKEEHMQYKQFLYTRDRVLKLYTEKDADTITVDDHRFALERLEWRYVKLLLARSRMNAKDFTAAPADVSEEISQVQQELQVKDLTEALRRSKTARLETLEQRFELLQHRDQSITEIDAGLARIDEKLKLLLEQAGLHSTPAEIAAEFDSSSLHLDGLFGDYESAVETTDHFYEQLLEGES